MGTMIEVKPETAKQLHSLAAGKGVSVDDLLRVYVPELTTNGAIETTARQSDKLTEFRAWVNQFSTPGAGLSDEAISRASIYPDR